MYYKGEKKEKNNMNNMRKLERSLQFYVLGNKLKTTVFDEKNYLINDFVGLFTSINPFNII